MLKKIFSKRSPLVASEARLGPSVRQRIQYCIEKHDPFFKPDDWNSHGLYEGQLPDLLKGEHGWKELRAYKSKTEWEPLNTMADFIIQGVPRFVLDAIELFYDLLEDHNLRSWAKDKVDLGQFQRDMNSIFEDGKTPWRLLEGRIIKVDSQWLEEEVHAKAIELLKQCSFSGALDEFLQARTDLSAGDNKGAMHSANLALESTIKAILNLDNEKPGVLIRKLIDSGLIPSYHKDFLDAFEKHILRCVPVARNTEKGVGHGQGAQVNEPPESLAQLAVNLTGVLVLFLLKQHMSTNPPVPQSQELTPPDDDSVPF